MKRRPVVIAGLALAALTVLGAAAYAAGPTPGPATAEKVDVKDGKVYRNGEQVGTVPADAGRVTVSHKDGKIRVGGGDEAGPGRVTGDCPAPDAGGRSVETTEVKDGKVYRNGKEAGRVTGDGKAPLTVAYVDGKVQINKDGKPAAGASVTRDGGDGKGDAGPVVTCTKGR
ncbi:MAG: hypothetical protein IRZ07_22935 [Microbispora sp.]|nr:hypothetical protein [Microbispora sp.]